MGLIAVAADKGAPGVTTTTLALAAVWPRPVLLAECDPAGGDLAFRFPSADGQRLDPRRGMLSLAVAARHGLQPGQVWEHTQKLYGGIDVLLGVTNADQGASLSAFWGQLGRVLAGIPQADVFADCGRLGADGPATDLLAEASQVLLLTRAEVGEIIRLRDRVVALATAVEKRGRRGFIADIVVIADQKNFQPELAEVAHVLSQGRAPARVLGGIASDARAAGLLRGHWGGKLDKSLLIRSVRDIAGQLAAITPQQPTAPTAAPRPAYERPAAQPAADRPAPAQHSPAQYAPGQQAAGSYTPGQPSPGQYASGQQAPGQRSAGQHSSSQYGSDQQAPEQYSPGQYGSGQQSPDQYGSSEQAPEQYGPGQLSPGQHGSGGQPPEQHSAGQLGSGPYGAVQQESGEYGPGQYAADQPAPDQQASGQYGGGRPAVSQQVSGGRAARHRYEPDGRAVPAGDPRQDGATAHGQVPQRRGR